jgi:hypothetical protein
MDSGYLVEHKTWAVRLGKAREATNSSTASAAQARAAACLHQLLPRDPSCGPPLAFHGRQISDEVGVASSRASSESLGSIVSLASLESLCSFR